MIYSMKLKQIKNELTSQTYDFLRTDIHLNHNIAILTLGGSHAYGTSTESSDIDLRGCALNSKANILSCNTYDQFEQFTNKETDTVIYGFNKLIQLLSNVNPNTIEILGNKPEHYFYVSPIGRELINNAHMFLSKKAIYSFGGYANQQLRRLDNKAVRLTGQSENEAHILKTIEHASYTFAEKYFDMPTDAIKLYIDEAIQENYDTEIFMDISLKHYPLRDYKMMWAEMQEIVKSYSKIGKRNENAITHDKLGKHMMHLIRIYMMCIDILESEQIITYREKEHNLLMDIRNGKYLDSNKQPTPEFFEMVNDYEKKLDYAKTNTSLPAVPDIKRINEFVISVNERIIKNAI